MQRSVNLYDYQRPPQKRKDDLSPLALFGGTILPPEKKFTQSLQITITSHIASLGCAKPVPAENIQHDWNCGSWFYYERSLRRGLWWVKRPSVLHFRKFQIMDTYNHPRMNSQPGGICVERNVSPYTILCEPSPSFNQIRVNIKNIK